MTLTKEQLTNIIESADEVITALAGTNEDMHPESDSMIHLWDYLNDVAAPPEVVKRLAEIALASLDAEPVSFDALRDAVAEVSGAPVMEWSDSFYKGHQVVPFINFNSLARIVDKFRTAPPSPVVPDFVKWFEDVILPAMKANGIKPAEQKMVYNSTQLAWNACRAAMLQGAEPVTKECKLPDDFDFDRFNDVVWLETVASNPHMHSPTTSTIAMVALELSKRLESGNSPAIPDGWVACSERMPAKGQEVLCTDQFENYETALYDTGYIPGPPFFATTAGEFHPTHWMPLPAAPQQE